VAGLADEALEGGDFVFDGEGGGGVHCGYLVFGILGCGFRVLGIARLGC
jgi:hypothetical protein